MALEGESRSSKVALVYAPWGSVQRPSLALGILKECARQAGFTPHVHYLNVRFAERIGFQLYENITNTSAFYPDWFFSARLFGPTGLGTIPNSWEQLQSTPQGRSMADILTGLTGGSVEAVLQVADAVNDFISSCLRDVDWGSYLAVGFSLTFAQSLAALLLAREIKEAHPHVAIILGGASVDSEMGFELLRSFEWIDYVVHGEAEVSFPALLAALEGNRPPRIPGVSMRLGGELVSGSGDAQPVMDLNTSPAPDYSDYFNEVQARQVDRSVRVTLLVESSRGCWWGAKQHCTFCGLNGTTMQYRKKDGSRVFDEIMQLANRHRCLSFSAVDNILDMGYFRELLPSLAASDIDLSLFYEVKANLTRSQLQLMAEAGINRIQPGIESFSSELLRMMRKGVTAIQNVQLLKWCFELGIDPQWNILYGFPGEEPQHYEHYPTLMRSLLHLRPPSGLTAVVFERFSPYHFDRQKFKLTIRPLPDYHMIYPPHVNTEKIAYYFQGEWEGQNASSESYIRPVKEIYRSWLRLWQEKGAVFYYDKGPGFLTLYDSRPLREGMNSRPRRTMLNDLQSRIYLFCDENRSFQAIRKMLVSSVSAPPDEAQTQQLLDQFVGQGMMMREGERYLSLAVRRKANRASLSDASRKSDSNSGADVTLVPTPTEPLLHVLR